MCVCVCTSAHVGTSSWEVLFFPPFLPRQQPEDLFYKYSRNLSNDANGSPESSDPVSSFLPSLFQTKTNARERLFRGAGSLTLPPCLLLYRIASLTAIYPAKSYFRWKFIALARIEASFPDERNKESAVPRPISLVRRIIGTCPPRLLSPAFLTRRPDKSIARLARM